MWIAIQAMFEAISEFPYGTEIHQGSQPHIVFLKILPRSSEDRGSNIDTKFTFFFYPP
jgi:hypothetical protein